MHRLTIAAAIAVMISALYGLIIVESEAKEFAHNKTEQVIYGHRVGPGGQLMILTTR